MFVALSAVDWGEDCSSILRCRETEKVRKKKKEINNEKEKKCIGDRGDNNNRDVSAFRLGRDMKKRL